MPRDEAAVDTDDSQLDRELAVVEPVAVALPATGEAIPELPRTTQRMTSHAQGRLAALSSFDQLYQDAQGHLQEVEAKLTEVRTSHQLTRELFNILHSDVHRANELELANSSLIAEQARLSDRLRDANGKRQEAESLAAASQERETSLAHDKELLRNALAAAKLETIEAANTIAKNEAELGDIIKNLTAKTIECERRSHENEALREKHLNLSVELDRVLSRESETRRKLDEISIVHANEAARNAELLLALGNKEKEVLRLEMSLAALQTKQSELTEDARTLDAEKEAEIAHNLHEMSNLRSEIQGFQSRLEHASHEHREASSAIDILKSRLSDVLTEKEITDERMFALVKESDIDKSNLATANANFAQLSLDRASEQMQLDVQRQECEDLRVEIALLNARVEELLPFERLYRVTKAKQHSAVDMADVADLEATSVPTDSTRAESGHETMQARRRRADPGFRP
jgi:chromosome segregation ATPase